jgi:predicted transcriptional regulator
MVATEKMKAKIEEEQLQREFESLNSKVKEVQDSLEENIEKILKEKEEEDKKLKNIDQLNELVDRKIQDVYEKMRGDNLYIWKESISLAEKEFSSKGLKETLSLLPKLPYDSADLKRTINSLIDKEDQVPPSIVKFNHQA